MKAVEVIMEHGVPEDRIVFINLVRVPFHDLQTSRIQISVKISSPQGLRTFATRYPSLKVVCHFLAACPV
jgi:uracil phosphoribosyltransferase